MVSPHLVKGEDQYAEQVESERDDLSERLSAFVGKLETEAKRRVMARKPVEDRWIEDLRQYHGKYGPEVMEKMKKQEASRSFLNLTRPKTNAMMARLWDLLFPTDDRNWGIRPTPVPEMADRSEEVLRLADDAGETIADLQAKAREAEAIGDMETAQALMAQMQEAEEVKSEAEAAADELHEMLAEATRRSDLMQEHIDDQLKGCSYQAEARDAIEDACKVGIGVLKGPVLAHKAKQRWERAEDGTYVLNASPGNDAAPSAYRVDFWGFFPDPDVRRVADGEGVYERHLMNRKKMRDLAKRPDIDKDAVRDLIKTGPTEGSVPAYIVDLNDLDEQSDVSTKDMFQVWEYTGPVDHEEMDLLALAFERDVDPGESDPLVEMHAKIWFCEGRILSFAVHPLDSNETVYSVYNLEEAENSPFGYGIPYLMRDPQSILNAAQRMMNDNAGLASGSQLVVNKQVVTPQDGNWTLTPRKIWIRNNAEAPANQPPFETYDIPMHQAEIANMMELSRRAIDDVTAMPQIAQGEQGTGVTKTAQGMALLMNSANVVFRRVVKNFDDNVTVPMIRRFYHWNMQFSRNEAIKGDYEVDARGSSVLLVREMQANNLMMIAQIFGDHPIWGTYLKRPDLFRQIIRAHMIPADEITKSDREIKEEEAKTAPPDPTIQIQIEELNLRKEEMDLKAQMHEREWAARLEIARLEHDRDLQKEAERLNTRHRELDGREAAVEASRSDRTRAAEVAAASKERALAAEIAEKHRTGVSSGGSV